jgi:hypothetical protein
MKKTIVVALLCGMATLASGHAASQSDNKAQPQLDPQYTRNGAMLLNLLPRGVVMTQMQIEDKSVTYYFTVSTLEQLQAIQRLSLRVGRPTFEHFVVTTHEFRF